MIKKERLLKKKTLLIKIIIMKI